MRVEHGPSLVRLALCSPWINTCIGFKNRKPFILMLIYTILATLVNVVAAILSFSAMMDVFQSKLPGKIAEDVIVAIALILNIIILVTIFNFLLFHLRLIFNNQTTIETLELARQGKNPE
jgi:palmitoyltransferase